jgi:hypothetical protein
MNQNSKVSGECFSENVRLFGNQLAEPEQFNLYNMMSQQIRQFDRKIEEQSRPK